MAKKRTAKSIKASCVRLARKAVNLRDGVCQKCGGSVNLQCCHVKVRKYNATTCDLLNLILLCSSDPYSGHEGCHQWFDRDIISSGRWFEATFPARADHLAEIERSRDDRIKVWRDTEWLEVETFLKDYIRDL
ncbi:unnamed protein product [marine sediment metagenome]|uniref:HNH nuclease domain-containing protein n=1 Tax=marine sediment metagenome TaxID=412755 RepID=X0SIV8_9ZZZZ